MAREKTYTGEQVAQAARELRQAAGADEERFSARQVVSMLGEEVRLLRERGFTDERIMDLMGGFEIEVTASDLAGADEAPHFGP